MLIECKICGELCKDDIGLRNHFSKLKAHGNDKKHPPLAEYRKLYMSGSPPPSKVKIDYIIPISNINDDGFTYRLRNLNTIIRIVPEFVNVVLVEQMINPVYKLYSKSLKTLPKDINIIKKIVKYPIFNKGWLYNIGVNLSKTNHVILAEGDINVNRKYFTDLKDFILENDHNWFFAWDKIIYWNIDFTEKLKEETPRESKTEGGLIYFNKNFYWKIGGSNEGFQELGGIDNELASRARFMSSEDKLFVGTINHLWHPISYLKKNNWIYGKHYVKNRILYYKVRDNPELAIEELRRMRVGNIKHPVEDNLREMFFKALNVDKTPTKRGYR